MFGNKDRAFDVITRGGDGPSGSDDWVGLVAERMGSQDNW